MRRLVEEPSGHARGDGILVTRDDTSRFGQARGDAQRGVAAEGPDLERTFGTAEADEELEKRPFDDSDLHLRRRQFPIRRLSELFEQRGSDRGVILYVVGQPVGDEGEHGSYRSMASVRPARDARGWARRRL